MEQQQGQLKKTLGPLMLWGLGVGYVISGEYFGWNLGLEHGGPYGMLVATLIITVMYVTFVFSYTELACSIPKAGGVFVYATRAFGPKLGLSAGLFQLIEFVFAPPAIAAALAAYLSLFIDANAILPFESELFTGEIFIAMCAFIAFTLLNIYGVKQSATFELAITVIAVAELLIFAGATLPHFTWEAFSKNPLPNGWSGVWPALPFAIWFYLAIEGVANVAEEAKNPQRDVMVGFGSAMATLVFLALLTFFAAVGVGGWEAIAHNDRPLPSALGQIVSEGHILFHLLVTVGLFGLVASFNGIILVAGRATFEFGRVGYFPKRLGETHPKYQTPHVALLTNMLIGFIALLTGKTGEIITIAAFGAVSLYAISMLAQMKLRKTEPDLERPYVTPLYPILPIIALVLSVVSFVAMFIYNLELGLIFLGMVALGYLYFFTVVPKELRENAFTDDMDLDTTNTADSTADTESDDDAQDQGETS